MLVLLLAFPALRAEDKPQDKDKSPSPKKQYDDLVNEYSEAQQAYFSAMREAKTPEERQKIVAEKSPKPEKFALKFLELAEKNPTDPVAVDALFWIANAAPDTTVKAERAKAFAILLANHIENPKLGTACQSLSFSYEKQDQEFLRAVLAKNPNKSVKADASLALAQSLQQRGEIIKRLADDPALASRFEEFRGKDAVAELLKTDRAKLKSECQTAFREFVDEYAADMNPERIAQLCRRLSFSADESGQSLLRSLMEKVKRREVQGVACLALGQSLKQQSDAAHDKDPKAAAVSRAECEKLLERAEKEFADVKLAFRGTVGEKAKSELYELRHLAVGLPVPEVAGEDQDGKKFKLSDYKGKVVLLDFWSEF
jgi:hypothetical protein